MKSKMSILLAGALLASTSVLAAGIATLESVKGTPASLDASDAAWAKAKPVTVMLDQTPYKPDGYKGMMKSNAIIQSLYDDKNIYIKYQYDDPTYSITRQPWEKQADGSWKQLKVLDQTGHDNTYYEDKAAVYWNISTKGFDKKGCAIACHITKEGMNNGFSDNSAGRKYTNNLGETLDMWHWKGVRGGLPFEQTHDQFVDSTNDPKLSKEWGRKGDEQTKGGYKNNINEAKTGPAFMNKDAKDNVIGSIKEENKVPFVDTFKAGDRIPGPVVTKHDVSAGDIATKAVWKDGKWTLVFKRALVTPHPKAAEQDVQFSDLKKSYFFAVSAFDNSQINHVYHDGAIELKFK